MSRWTEDDLDRYMRRDSGGTEPELMAACFKYLELLGYRRHTAHNHDDYGHGKLKVRGWFNHIHGRRAMGVGQQPDLVIESAKQDVAALQVELKCGEHPTWQPGQMAMVQAGNWHLATTFDEFKAILDEWQKTGRNERACDKDG